MAAEVEVNQAGIGERSTAGTLARHALVLALLFALLSGAYWAAVYLVSGQAGMPLDDSYIHLQYARSIVEGRPFEYNPGVRSNGTSAPLWTIMLVPAYRITHDWLSAAWLLGVLWTIPCVALTYWLVLRWTGRAAWALLAGAALVLCNPVVVSAYEGMEVPAYAAMFVAGLLLYDFARTAGPGNDRRWRLAASAALAVGVWLRPEFLVMPAVIAAERGLALRREGEGWRGRWLREMAAHAGVWAVLLAPYLGFNLWASGTLLPNTFAIKAVVRNSTADVKLLAGLPTALRQGDGWALLRAVTLWPALMALSLAFGLLVNNAVLAWRLPGSVRRAWRGAYGPAGTLAAISLLAFPLARVLVDPIGMFIFQFQRYFAHITPVLVLLGVAALATRAASVRPSRRLWTAAVTAGLIGAVLTGGQNVLAVDNINDMQVYTGRWLAAHTPPDAVIATNDVGAIAFYSGRRIVDTVALTEPALADLYLAGGTLEQYLQQVRPTHACLFSQWHDGIAARKDLFDIMFKVRIQDIQLGQVRIPANVICGGPSLWVMRTRWNDEFGRGRIDPATYVLAPAPGASRRAEGDRAARVAATIEPKGL